MCQEIYVEDAEAERPEKECWCPLADCYTEVERQKALAQLGSIVYEALMKKTEANLDQSEIKIEVSLRRW